MQQRCLNIINEFHRTNWARGPIKLNSAKNLSNLAKNKKSIPTYRDMSVTERFFFVKMIFSSSKYPLLVICLSLTCDNYRLYHHNYFFDLYFL